MKFPGNSPIFNFQLLLNFLVLYINPSSNLLAPISLLRSFKETSIAIPYALKLGTMASLYEGRAAAAAAASRLEEGNGIISSADIVSSKGLNLGGGKELHHGHGRTAHSMSSSSLRKKSDLTLVSKVRCGLLRNFLANLQEMFFGTKLFILFPTVPLAIAADYFNFGRAWIFALSLLGLIPLAERVSFLTEQIAFHTGPTVGGLLNATCGNATELIIALFALQKGKIDVVKCSLVGSILSNLLLVLGSSLFCGGLANIGKEQLYDRRQGDVNSSLLMLGALCHMLTLMFKYAINSSEQQEIHVSVIDLSRACSIIMLIAYVAYIFFQLKTHRQLFEAKEDDEQNDMVSEQDEVVMGFPSAMAWLVGMTIVIAVLSEYVVGTIEAASESWGISISFISIILLPIVGNAAEHAGAIIFAFKNKLDITLGVSLGSATQISMFVIPLSVIVAWIMGIEMDLDFKLLETGSLIVAILVTCFALQDGTSHYLKGFVLLLCYFVIGACFFVLKSPPNKLNAIDLDVFRTNLGVMAA